MNRNEIEQKILEIWKSIFQKQEIGMKDNFFVIGGDSLKAIKILQALQKENIITEEPSMQLIYANLTIEAMTNYIIDKNKKMEEGKI